MNTQGEHNDGSTTPGAPSIGGRLTSKVGEAPRNILVVEDESDTLELITFNLSHAGYEVRTARNGDEALRKTFTASPDLLLLDLILPDIDGLDICKLLRADPKTRHLPILMLTGRASEVDRILGLELGANDYMTKPFSPRELLLRIRNLVTKLDLDQPADLFESGELYINVARRLVKVGDRVVPLTATEFRLLATLAQGKGEVQTRERMRQQLFKTDTPLESRTIDTHMQRLRQKLGKACRFIHTIRGVGYRLLDDSRSR